MLRSKIFAPVLAALLALAACVPMLPPIGNPWTPASANAQQQPGAPAPPSSAEVIARRSVPISAGVQGFTDAAGNVISVVPGGAPFVVPLDVVEKFMEGYRLEMERQIQGLEAKQAAGQRVTYQDWIWALLFAGGAGGVAVFRRRATA